MTIRKFGKTILDLDEVVALLPSNTLVLRSGKEPRLDDESATALRELFTPKEKKPTKASLAVFDKKGREIVTIYLVDGRIEGYISDPFVTVKQRESPTPTP